MLTKVGGNCNLMTFFNHLSENLNKDGCAHSDKVGGSFYWLPASNETLKHLALI